jgi:uncharacterized protein YeaO (DUF488 family)
MGFPSIEVKTMPISTKRIYEPATPEDGFRLLVMRLWPRGVAKSRVDAWDRGLAPSRELLTKFRAGALLWEAYVQRFHQEMAERPDSTTALADLRQRIQHETVTLLCGCADAVQCHRTLLVELVSV